MVLARLPSAPPLSVAPACPHPSLFSVRPLPSVSPAASSPRPTNFLLSFGSPFIPCQPLVSSPSLPSAPGGTSGGCPLPPQPLLGAVAAPVQSLCPGLSSAQGHGGLLSSSSCPTRATGTPLPWEAGAVAAAGQHPNMAAPRRWWGCRPNRGFRQPGLRCGVRPPAAPPPSSALPLPCVPICLPRLSCLPSSAFPPQLCGEATLGCIARGTSAPEGLCNQSINFLSLFLWSPFSPSACVSSPWEMAEDTGMEGGCVKLFSLASEQRLGRMRGFARKEEE